MENQRTRETSYNTLTETYNDGFRETTALNNADAGMRQNAQYGSDNSAGTLDEQRTAQRWWLRKRLMGL